MYIYAHICKIYNNIIFTRKYCITPKSSLNSIHDHSDTLMLAIIVLKFY